MINIIGAGMAGLLAANMLRRHDPIVTERQPFLPNNHHAVLRFRSLEVSKQLRIPFREVRVFKGIDQRDPIRAAGLYAKKVMDRYEVRSLINLEPSTRYIAPPDLVDRMAEGVRIHFSTEVGPLGEPLGFRWEDKEAGPVISTMPMGVLMDLLRYDGPRPEFVHKPGWTIGGTILECDMFATRYYTTPHFLPYRASITGDELIIEGTDAMPSEIELDPMVRRVKGDFGLDEAIVINPSVHESRYAKIGRLSPEDRAKADEFMFWATSEFNIYSLGRFATWRAGLLLDDLVNDIIKIERWIGGTRYDLKRSI